MASRVLLLVRDVPTSVSWWKATGLVLKASTANWARFTNSSERSADIDLLAVADEAKLTTGYGPLLQLRVRSVADAIPVLLGLGGHLDGAIVHGPSHAVATLRSPDGHFVSLIDAAEGHDDANGT